MHAVADGHATEVRLTCGAWRPSGCSSVQLVPSQSSAKGAWPPPASADQPTVMQAVDEEQDTPPAAGHAVPEGSQGFSGQE
jgi:hypothetical protein